MAGTVNLKSKISLDDSEFVSGMKKVGRATATAAKKASAAFRKIGAAIGKAAARMKNFALIAGALTFGAAIAGAYKLGRALKDAFDLGGRLSDLSAQTGVAVDQLAILQQAFEDNGVAADSIGSVINKLQRSITDFGAGLSTQSRAFERLGITFDEIKNKSPLEQFKMVQNAIANMQDPTQKAATAMELFGRAGGDLMALFQDSGAIEKASVTMGSSAEILRKNAERFDRISDLLNRASVKFQGIILALAEVAAPKILLALEQFNKMDFAGIGQRFLAGLDIDGAKNLLMSAAKVVAAFLGNKMVEAIRLSASLFEVAFNHVTTKIAAKYVDRIGQAVKDGAEIQFFAMTGQFGKAMMKMQIATGKTAGEQAKTLEDKMMAAQKAFKDKITKDEDPFGFKKAAEDLDKAMSDIMAKGKDKIASRSESDEYDAELAAQKARVKRDEEMARAAKAQKAADLAKINDFLTGSVPDHVSANMPLKKDPRGQSAFQKLQASTSAFDLLQGRKAQGIAVGKSTSLSQNGMGVKRYTNPAREAARIAKEQKKDVRDQTEILRDVDKKLEQGLAVN
jgi:hypothetical protein